MFLPRPSRRCSTGALVLLLSLAGCATTQETPQQAYVWEMGRICDGKSPFWRIERVEADGRYWVQGATNAPPGMNDYFACMKEQFAKTPYRTWVSQRSASPQITTPTPSPIGSVAPSAAAPITQKPAASAPLPTSASADAPLLPSWALKDEWSYRSQSPRSKSTFVWVVDRFETVEGIDSAVIKTGDRETFYRRGDGALHLDKVGGIVQTRWTPPLVQVAWPLEVGKSWNPVYTVARPEARQTDERLLACKIEGEGEVTVVAGAFRAFHIVCRNQRSGAPSFEIWYSLEVRNMVKDLTYYSYGVRERELTGYKLAERGK
jgi:hypothetical protein